MPIYEWHCATCDETLEVVRCIADHKLAPVHPHKLTRVLSAAYVTPDIAPYRAVAGDKMGQMIGSRREHREFLKRNRFVEVGNEPVKPIRNSFKPKKGEIAAELKQVIQPYLR